MPPPTEMFIGRGLDAARVSEVAKARAVSEDAFYDYFPSEESLVRERRNTPLVESLRSAIKGSARRRSVVLA